MTTKGASEFDLLLGEINTLSTDIAKSAVKDDTAEADKKIAAAAEEGETADKDVDADADKDVAKSFSLKLEDGTVLEAIDGAALFKSLSERVEKNETTVAGAVRGLMDVVKSLADQVKTLSTSGKGRKAVLSINEKVPAAATAELAKSETDGVTADVFFAKALSLQSKGELSGNDIRRAESYLNRNLPVPADIVARVFPAGK